MSIIFENNLIRIERESSQIPWVKLFTQDPYKEMSHVPHPLRLYLYALLQLIEEEMIAYYQPTKINLASFGNYLPHLHWHIMARFEEDNYFPEPMWGEQQRQTQLTLPPFSLFEEKMVQKIKQLSYEA